jgi:hypothetical protein
VNSNFQIAYFLAGSCHTPDGAYAVLCNLRESREIALAQVKASSLREKAKRIRAQRMLVSEDEAARVEAEADLAELDANKELASKNISAAKDELDFINQCIERVQSHRRYKDLPDPKAHEACQAEEWRLELIHRAENYLLTTGTIPPDHFATMRMHPEFKDGILPGVKKVRKLMASDAGQQQLLGRGNPVLALLNDGEIE